MSQIRICDRCQAPATLADATTTAKNILLPKDDPATASASADVGVTMAFTIAAPIDLCPICQASALIEYALQLVTVKPIVLLKPFAARGK